MNRSQELMQQEVETIANILANCHDLYVLDLHSELDQALAWNCKDLNPKSRHTILNSFLNVSIEDRISPYFDHTEFVRDCLKGTS